MGFLGGRLLLVDDFTLIDIFEAFGPDPLRLIGGGLGLGIGGGIGLLTNQCLQTHDC